MVRRCARNRRFVLAPQPESGSLVTRSLAVGWMLRKEHRLVSAGTYERLSAGLIPRNLYVRRVAIQVAFFSAMMPFISWTHLYLCTGRDTHSVPHFSAPLPYSVDVPHESGPEGQMEFCRKGRCNGRWKPPGTHHCSTCGICRMGFDHHCPWVTTCSSHSAQTSLSHSTAR